MALNASKIEGGKKFPKAPALEPGAYPARVVQIVSLGLQPQRAYKGEEKPPKPELYVTYEILDEFMKDEDGNDIEDKPRWISERFPMNSLDSDLATSTKRYFALDAANKFGGDWSKLAGTPCTVTVVNYENGKGETRDKVASISSMRPKEAAKAPELVNEPKVFDIDEPDMEVYNSFPKWLHEVMEKDNLEFPGSALEKAIKSAGGKVKEKDEEDSQEDEVESKEDEDEEW